MSGQGPPALPGLGPSRELILSVKDEAGDSVQRVSPARGKAGRDGQERWAPGTRGYGTPSTSLRNPGGRRESPSFKEPSYLVFAICTNI